MTTRATIHFQYDDNSDAAIVYRHTDGYPDGLGADLKKFLEDVELHTKDHRFNDPEYLAAKWVVWDASQHRRGNELDFVGIGIYLQDPDDIRYRYRLICSSESKPEIICEEVL